MSCNNLTYDKKFLIFVLMIKNRKKFILETFLSLTSETYPYGFEDDVMKKMINNKLLPETISKDAHGNYFLQIGESRTIFASHLDTVSREKTSVRHIIKGDTIYTDNKTILGADDKAGVTIMLWMILHNIPGLYYFFMGEEVGCIGSGLLAKYGDLKGQYDRIISFDRKGTDSVITYQSGTRCCSDDFANQLAKELNKRGLSYKKDETGVYTDSAEFVDLIPECTNLSVGYYKEHTVNEHQDISHLERLAEAVILVDWENLVTKRDTSKTEYRSYGYGDYCGGYTNYNQYDWRNRDSEYNYKKSKKRKRKEKYFDDWYDQNDSFGFTAGKTYYDGVDGLVEVNKEDKKSKNFSDYSYEWIMEKFTGKELTQLELEIIREQYLDMNLESDKAFYAYLRDVVNSGVV